MTSKEKVLSVYPEAQCIWTSRGWRVMGEVPGIGMEEIGRTRSAHVPEDEAWDDAASKLPSAPSPAGETASETKCMSCGSDKRKATPEAPMNSDHAPTAEEQLPPLAIVYTEEMRESQTTRYDAILKERERQLLAALRENREMKRKGMWDCDMPTVREAIKRAEAAEAKLRAVSDALDEKPVTVFHVGELGYYLRSEIDVPLARIRAIVEGK